MSLPEDFIKLSNELSLASRTWQLFGISYKDLIEMDSYQQEMIKIRVELG
jgi:hypothetical protein